MSKGHVVDAMVKLTGEEIERLAKDHIGIVEVLAHRFDGHYLDMRVEVIDYRELLDDMDKSLKRAEKLIEILDAGGEE